MTGVPDAGAWMPDAGWGGIEIGIEVPDAGRRMGEESLPFDDSSNRPFSRVQVFVGGQRDEEG